MSLANLQTSNKCIGWISMGCHQDLRACDSGMWQCTTHKIGVTTDRVCAAPASCPKQSDPLAQGRHLAGPTQVPRGGQGIFYRTNSGRGMGQGPDMPVPVVAVDRWQQQGPMAPMPGQPACHFLTEPAFMTGHVLLLLEATQADAELIVRRHQQPHSCECRETKAGCVCGCMRPSVITFFL